MTGINTPGQALDPRDFVAQGSDASIGVLNPAVGAKNDSERAQSFFTPRIIIGGKKMLNISICIITEHKKDFLPLLLLGDEREDMIDKYLGRGTLFALYDGDLKSICVVTDEGKGTLEIQNIATDERYRKLGYASYLVNHIAERYKTQYDKITLGTGDVPSILAFYNRLGFITTHRIPDYFTEHYDQPIIEDGILLKDKVYLERKLK